MPFASRPALTKIAHQGSPTLPHLASATYFSIPRLPGRSWKPISLSAHATHGGVDKRRFEMYALGASIIGKCHFCVRSHFDNLKQEGLSTQQLRDIGRIAAVINAAAQVIAAQ